MMIIIIKIIITIMVRSLFCFSLCQRSHHEPYCNYNWHACTTVEALMRRIAQRAQYSIKVSSRMFGRGLMRIGEDKIMDIFRWRCVFILALVLALVIGIGISWLVAWLIGWLIGWLVDWSTGWQIKRLMWLIDWWIEQKTRAKYYVLCKHQTVYLVWID